MNIFKTKQLPICLLSALILIVTVEIFLFNSIRGKNFLLNWSYYKDRNAWFSLFRTKYHKDLTRAERSNQNGFCVVGTSTASSVFSDEIKYVAGKDVYNLSTVLCGGENLLLQLSQASFLPQKNIILFISEFSFYQPFSEYPMPGLINFKSFLFALKIFIQKPEFRGHKIYPAMKNSLVYSFIPSMRFASDFKYAFKHYIVHKLFNRKTSYPSLDLPDPKQTEIKQAQSLYLVNEDFKIYYFYKILEKLKKDGKNIIFIRSRFHSVVDKNINNDLSRRFDLLISDLNKIFNFRIIDMKNDIQTADMDYSDYTHFTEAGSKKILSYLNKHI